jgi:hypothetical protein
VVAVVGAVETVAVVVDIPLVVVTKVT